MLNAIRSAVIGSLAVLLFCSVSQQEIKGPHRKIFNGGGGAGITAGDAITCEPQGTSSSLAAATVSDTLNGSFTGVSGTIDHSGFISQYYFPNSAHGSSDTITFTATSSGQFYTMSCQAWKNVATSGALDSNTNNPSHIDSTTGANPSSGNFTTSTNGQLVLGFLLNTAATTPTGNGCTLIDTIPAEGTYSCYFVQTVSSSTTQVNWSDSSDTWRMNWASFKNNGSTIALDGTCHASHDNGSTNTTTVVVTISC